MARKPLSTEEIVELRSSPYIAKVENEKVTFTPEFKQVMYEGLLYGKTIRTTLEEHGIDPKILGSVRLWGIAAQLREDAEREGGFKDQRKNNSRKPAEETRERSLLARIDQLEHELAYTRQEVEFLKKIQAANSEAQKSWESKHRRK